MPRSKPKPRRSEVSVVASGKKLVPVAKHLATQPLIAFDTEFLWERTHSPRLGLIQIADLNRVWLIDPLAIPARQMRPLVDVLVSPDVLKVAHAVDQDQICLHRYYGAVAKPVLDTAVAAALTGMGEQIGLAALLKKLLRINVDKGYTRTNWLKRPLPSEMAGYAADDVAHLCTAANKLLKRLGKLDRVDWAMELSAKVGDMAIGQTEPTVVAQRLAKNRRLEEGTYKVLRELVAWREKEAKHLDRPRRWIADDKLLVKLAMARPKSIEKLADFRGLGISKRPKSLAKVLRAINAGKKAPSDGYKRPKRHVSPTQQESAAVVVLRCFLNALAAHNRIPARLLVANGEMVSLLRGKFRSVETLRKSKILDERAVDLIGEDLVAILNGHRVLRIVDGKAKQVAA